MADPFIYMRLPPGGASHFNDEFVDALKALSEVSDDVLNKIESKLNQGGFFLTKSEVKVAASFAGPPVAEALSKVLEWLDNLRKGDVAIEGAVSRLTKIAAKDEGESSVFTEEQITRLRNRLLRLNAIPGLVHQGKAEVLAVATGQRLREMKLICDLRPVFDESRQRVLGVIPVTIFKISYEGIDGLPAGIEVVLSEKEIDDLHRLSDVARTKLASLKRFSQLTGLTVPSTELANEANRG